MLEILIWGVAIIIVLFVVLLAILSVYNDYDTRRKGLKSRSPERCKPWYPRCCLKCGLELEEYQVGRLIHLACPETKKFWATFHDNIVVAYEPNP